MWHFLSNFVRFNKTGVQPRHTPVFVPARNARLIFFLCLLSGRSRAFRRSAFCLHRRRSI